MAWIEIRTVYRDNCIGYHEYLPDVNNSLNATGSKPVGMSLTAATITTQSSHQIRLAITIRDINRRAMIGNVKAPIIIESRIVSFARDGFGTPLQISFCVRVDDTVTPH
jgi:hypothetical protein